MTKPVTAACVMMLVDEGKLSLDDPIEKHLPQMSKLRDSSGKPVHITVLNLLNHTSGMAELPPEFVYDPETLEQVSNLYADVKIEFTPGSKWQYSQTSINTAARIIEVVSGMPFDKFVQSRICEPLEMNETIFYPSEKQLARLTTAYQTTPEAELHEQEIRIYKGKTLSRHDRFPAGNAGLFTTAGDYIKFCQMLLADGIYRGKKVLSPQAVKAMRTVTTGDLETGFTPGNAWGIGCCIVQHPQGVSKSLSPGSFGHGGAYGTQAWIDPTQNRIYLLMVQRTNFPNSDNSTLRGAFQDAAAEMLH